MIIPHKYVFLLSVLGITSANSSFDNPINASNCSAYSPSKALSADCASFVYLLDIIYYLFVSSLNLFIKFSIFLLASSVLVSIFFPSMIAELTISESFKILFLMMLSEFFNQ